MASPQLLDINELDKNHELLHDVYGNYDLDTTSGLQDQMIGQWRWPCVSKLEKLGDSGEELFAIYFSFVPPRRLLSMHRRLYQDIHQRIL
ncbi:hypothetical protein DFQ28_010959 [Apophysomyces sp. BC1034]|nr:hypothetical protein DFQ28_010959 [Apophysomyces sp. BC1034]